MTTLDKMPAVRRIDTDRPDLFAVDLVGEMSASDAENLLGLLEAAYALHPQIDLLVRAAALEAVDWAAVSPQTLSESREEARRHVRRCAVVGDSSLGTVGRFLAMDGPGELRRFASADEAAAWEWLSARPTAGR